MNDFIERRRRKPDYLESALVQAHNAEKIALWCGGVVNKERDRGVDEYIQLIIPNVEGNNKALVGDYVVRKENGRFYSMSSDEMEEYEVMSKRGIDIRDEHDARLKAVVGDDFKIAEKFTPHYVPRGQYPVGD